MENSIEIYQSKDGRSEIQVRIENESICLSQKQMAELFEKDSDTIGLHLKNFYSEGELEEKATTEESPVAQTEGNRKVSRKIRL
jgi:hypothetical protein